MTGREVAAHFGAKKTGKGRWIAKCSAHPDNRASMSITEGKRGVMLTCWSMRCDVRDIVAAAGLTMSQLFYDDGQKVDPKARAAMRRKRAAEDNAARRKAKQALYWTRQVLLWETVTACMHSQLIKGLPVAAQWHRALATARMRHERLLAYWPRAPEVECFTLQHVPSWITAPMVGREIAEILYLKEK